jgi:hypothetical protein
MTRHTHAMTHQELGKTMPEVRPGRRKRRAWVAGGSAVFVAGTAMAATLSFWHLGDDPGGDPGGVRQQTLHSISAAVPRDAKVQSHSVGRPIWDSCDGRPGTQGWSDVVDDYQFTSASSAATVVAGAKASMKIAGWKLTSTSASPLGPTVVWTKTVSGNVVAQAMLAVGTRGPSQHSPSFWDFVASAPPAGRRVSGC